MRIAALATAVALALTPMPADAAPTYVLVSSERGPGLKTSYYPHTAISGNGRFVAYHVQYNGGSYAGVPTPPGELSPATVDELWLADLVTGKKVKVITGNCCIYQTTLSRDGRYLVFDSWATDLVPNDKNGMTDVFVYDSKTRKVSRMVGVKGQELNFGAGAGVVTPDGKTVVYVSRSDVFNKRNQQLPPCTIYKYSLVTRKTTAVVIGGQPICSTNGQLAASSDGRYLAIATGDQYVREDAAGHDIYWVDTVAKRIALVSPTAAAGQQGVNQMNEHPSIDGAGRYVAWVSGQMTVASLTHDLTVMVRDMKTGKLIDVSTGLAGAASFATSDPKLSEDGNWLTFLDGHGEVPLANHADLRGVYIRDLRKDISTTERIEPLGSCLDADCSHPSSQNAVPSSDGKVIAYITNSGRAAGDDDQEFDVYVVRR